MKIFSRVFYCIGFCFLLSAGEARADSVVDTDITRYRKAAESGDAEAQYRLGMFYEAGNGVPQDAVTASRWYYQAAEQGHAAAQYEVGNCYARGFGFAPNQREALRWRRKAEAQGYIGTPKGHVFALLESVESVEAALAFTLTRLKNEPTLESAVKPFIAGVPGFVVTGRAHYEESLNHNRTKANERIATLAAAEKARQCLRETLLSLPENTRQQLFAAFGQALDHPSGKIEHCMSLKQFFNPDDATLVFSDWAENAEFDSRIVEKDLKTGRGAVLVSFKLSPLSQSIADTSVGSFGSFQSDATAKLRKEIEAGTQPLEGGRLFFMRTEGGLTPFYVAHAVEQVPVDREGKSSIQERKRATDESLRKAETQMKNRLPQEILQGKKYVQHGVDASGVWIYTLIFEDTGKEFDRNQLFRTFFPIQHDKEFT